MKIHKTAVPVLVLAFALLAAGDEYKIDRGHSQVGFGAKHLVISTVNGRFNDFSGVVDYNPQDVARSSVKVTIKTASIDTDNAARDKDLHQSEFLDVEKFPEITFESTRVEKRGDQLLMTGNLTIKGITRPVEIPFTLSGPINDPWGNARLAAEGSTTINRRDFNLTYNNRMQDGSAVVGDQVKIMLNIEAVKPKQKQ